MSKEVERYQFGEKLRQSGHIVRSRAEGGIAEGEEFSRGEIYAPSSQDGPDVNAALSRAHMRYRARAHAPTPACLRSLSHACSTLRNKCVFIAAVAVAAPLLMLPQLVLLLLSLVLFTSSTAASFSLLNGGPSRARADGPDRFT